MTPPVSSRTRINGEQGSGKSTAAAFLGDEPSSVPALRAALTQGSPAAHREPVEGGRVMRDESSCSRGPPYTPSAMS